MRLVPTRLVAPVGCGLCPRVWLWQSGVIGCLSVWAWQLDVIGTHCGLVPGVWLWQLDVIWCPRAPVDVVGARVCGSWMCLIPKCVA